MVCRYLSSWQLPILKINAFWTRKHWMIIGYDLAELSESRIQKLYKIVWQSNWICLSFLKCSFLKTWKAKYMGIWRTKNLEFANRNRNGAGILLKSRLFKRVCKHNDYLINKQAFSSLNASHHSFCWQCRFLNAEWKIEVWNQKIVTA